jgi:hypothetical protein
LNNIRRREEVGRKVGLAFFQKTRDILLILYFTFLEGVEWTLRYITTSFRGNYG